VRLASGAGYDIDAESQSGHISVPEMTVRGGFSRHRVEGKVGSGGPLVSVRIDSGNVTIQ
jgi:Putative adhesin